MSIQQVVCSGKAVQPRRGSTSGIATRINQGPPESSPGQKPLLQLTHLDPKLHPAIDIFRPGVLYSAVPHHRENAAAEVRLAGHLFVVGDGDNESPGSVAGEDFRRPESGPRGGDPDVKMKQNHQMCKIRTRDFGS